jgi:hypothetical protein
MFSGMKKFRRSAFRLGCLVSLLAPVIAIIIYPKANWLFAIPLLGVILLLVAVLADKGPTAAEVANRAERLLNGNYWGWDVDDYEHLNPKSEPLKNLWRRTMSIGGLPEKWTSLDDETKRRMLDVIAEIRRLEPTSDKMPRNR